MRCKGILLAFVFTITASAAHAQITLSVFPASPRYMEPVYARLTQSPFPVTNIVSARASMSGNSIAVDYVGIPDLGATTTDVMLGRFPAGTYTVTAPNAGPPVTFTVPPGPTVTSVPDPEPAVSYTDLWWNPAESGWGMSITQGPTNEVFAVWFVYDAAGNPIWYTLQPGHWNTMSGYTGPIYRTSGPAFTGAFDPSAVHEVQVGTGGLSFESATTGHFFYTIDGQSGTKVIQRQPIE